MTSIDFIFKHAKRQSQYTMFEIIVEFFLKICLYLLLIVVFLIGICLLFHSICGGNQGSDKGKLKYKSECRPHQPRLDLA